MSKEVKLTPVQTAIQRLESAAKNCTIPEARAGYYASVEHLKLMLSEEKQFMSDIWDAGQKWGSTEVMFDHGMKTRLDLENTQDKADFLSQYSNDKS